MKKKLYTIGLVLFLTNVMNTLHSIPVEDNMSEYQLSVVTTLEQIAVVEGERRMNGLGVNAVIFPFSIGVQGSDVILAQRMVTVSRVAEEVGAFTVRWYAFDEDKEHRE